MATDNSNPASFCGQVRRSAWIDSGKIETMIRTYQFRVKDSTCAKHLNEMACAVNTVWNYCNEAQLHALKWNQKWPNYASLCRQLSGCGALLGINSKTAQSVAQEYTRKRQQFKKAKLRWRVSNPKSPRRSLGWIPFKAGALKIDGDAVIYLKRRYRFWKSRDIEGVLKCGSFSQDARGRWYVNLTCEVADEAPTVATGAVGIDLGLRTLATMSDGTKIEAKRFYRDLEPALAVAQRAGKKKRTKAIHAKISNRRKDFLHKESTRLVRENGAIFVGNVNAAGLAKTKMAKSVLDAGWSTFRTQLEFKANRRQVVFVVVNETNTTRGCSECGALSGPQGQKDLGMSEWDCVECGAQHDRDINSSRLICRLGHQALSVGIPAS